MDKESKVGGAAGLGEKVTRGVRWPVDRELDELVDEL